MDSRGGRRYMPYAFTEQGIAMLSSVLHSDKATKVSLGIMRAFVEISITSPIRQSLPRRSFLMDMFMMRLAL